jgi:multidrug efflux system outer membrane protein
VARNYFDLRGLQEQLRVAVASLETQQAALELVDARFEVGRGTALDTERARALVKSTAANIPALEAALIRTRYRLAVLCGLQPTGLDRELQAAQPLPGLRSVQLAKIGSPAEMLRRRPDIQLAESQAAAAAAQVGVARSALFPQLTLGGTLGQNSSHFSDLGKGASYVYDLGAQLTWNLLDFGRIRAQIAAADARNDVVMINYERAVLGALEETEGALASYTRTQRQTELLFESARASELAAEIARERFTVGSTDFLTVLDAERELLSARDRLAQAQAGAATSLVAVYKALAGGWEVPAE